MLARAHTDVSTERMRVAGFDDSRYPYFTNLLTGRSQIIYFNINNLEPNIIKINDTKIIVKTTAVLGARVGNGNDLKMEEYW